MAVYPAITTTAGSDWRQMLADCTKLGVKEVALFPTCLGNDERQEYFAKTKEAGITSVPFVHLRSDMGPDEIEFLMKEFGTKVFNIHGNDRNAPQYDLSEFKDRIYVENLSNSIIDEIKNWAGLCLDVSHLEDKILKNDPLAKEIFEILEKYPCGCWHLNTVAKTPMQESDRREEFFYDVHSFADLSDFDYCLKYKKYVAPHIALELENPIAEQLEAKKYLEKLLEI